MTKGLALTIGLNAVDPQHYGDWSGELMACEADAEDMAEIAKSKKFQTTTLLTKNGTREKVAAEIRKAASTLKSGDMFMLSYSGHGGQVPDKNDDEPDAQDETWCLYDGELLDDETYSLLSELSEGVRILVFSDSCHSGTSIKAAYYSPKLDIRNTYVDTEGTRYRCCPTNVLIRTYRMNREFYDNIQKNEKLKNAQDKVTASCVLISGCQDNQLSADGTFNGLFTANLLQVWKDGSFTGNYIKFHKAIQDRMPQSQSPNYFIAGQNDPRFQAQQPFTI